jgi:hypothetical protein
MRGVVGCFRDGAWISVTEDRSFEVTKHNAPGRSTHKIVRQERDLSATARRIDYKRWNGKTAGVAAQRFHDLDSLPYTCPQMIGADDAVALIQIIWPNSNAQESLKKVFHRRGVIIDACQQDGLIAQWNSQPGQLLATPRSLRCELARMIEVCIDPKWRMLVQQSKQIVGESHRQHHRFARSNAYKLDVPYRTNLRENIVKLIRRKSEWISAADQHIAHLLVSAQVGYCLIDFGSGRRGVADVPVALSNAETAVAGAERSNNKQNTVRVSMRQSGRHLIVPFRKRIVVSFTFFLHETRNDHPADRDCRVSKINQGEVVRRNGKTKPIPQAV